MISLSLYIYTHCLISLCVYTCFISFNNSSTGSRLLDLRTELVRMFDDIIKISSRLYKPEDRCQLTLKHGSISDGIFIHLQDLKNFDGEMIMDTFVKVLNSNEEIRADESFVATMGFLKKATKSGGGKRRLPLLPHLDGTENCSILNKRSLVSIKCGNDLLCAAKSIIVCMAKLHGWDKKSFHKLIHKREQCLAKPGSLITRARELQKQTGLPLDKKVSVQDLNKFEQLLSVKILVVNMEQFSDNPLLLQCSNRIFNDMIFLYLSNSHFHAIVNPHALFRKKTICYDCLGIYTTNDPDHECNKKSCYVCGRSGCLPDGRKFCSDCNLTCNSEECYQHHKTGIGRSKSKCSKRKKCLECKKVVNLAEQDFADHICHQYKCKACQKYVDPTHLCYLRHRKASTEQCSYVFFDLESSQSELLQCQDGYEPYPKNAQCKTCTEYKTCEKCLTCRNCRSPKCGNPKHTCTLAIVQLSCQICQDIPVTPLSKCGYCGDLCKICRSSNTYDLQIECDKPECGLREKIFEGEDALIQFGQWAISPSNRNKKFLSYNGSGFDTHFVLNYCVEYAKIQPQVIFAGSKLLRLYVGEGLSITFIDAMKFMKMSLKDLPKAMGLDGDASNGPILQKGSFPHVLNTPENRNLKCSWPPLSMYDMSKMGDNERKEFIKWHAVQQGRILDLRKELIKYCRCDVQILRLACMKFRRLFMDITTVKNSKGVIISQIDPFTQVTLASAGMKTVRVNFIQELHKITLSNGFTGKGIFKAGK